MTEKEILEYIEDYDIQFIRLTFFDVFGHQKNIAIMPEQLKRAIESGIPFDAGAVTGFCPKAGGDLFLEPDLSTVSIVPWRSLDGGVIRILCDITEPDGTAFVRDTRHILKEAERKAREQGVDVEIGTDIEFYIFKRDTDGNPTKLPHDNAGYCDVAPRDKGENIRRDICQMLKQMGIVPWTSRHEQGPGQHEVGFMYSDPLQTADNTTTFRWIVENTIELAGAQADFSPKPLRDMPGNGMHINISLKDDSEGEKIRQFMAGVLDHIREMTLFLNPGTNSYERLGTLEAPGMIGWSSQGRNQLIRIPAARSGVRRFELRSPDPAGNPYLAYALVINAGLDGIARKLDLPEPSDFNLREADSNMLDRLDRLPANLEEAKRYASDSAFVRSVVPGEIIDVYCNGS